MLQIIQQYEHSVKFLYLDPDLYPGPNYPKCVALSASAFYGWLDWVKDIIGDEINPKGTYCFHST